MDWSSEDWKPTVRIRRVMMGEVSLYDEDQGIQSVCMAHITTAAHIICRKPKKEQRKAALDRVPESLRPIAEQEVLRVWHEHYASSAPDPLPS